MTSNRKLPNLSRSELQVMKVVWAQDQLSAREVHDVIGDREDWEYSTTRTVLGRLVKKGVVSKRTFHGIQLYRARISRVQGLAKLVREFAERVMQVDPALVVPLFAQGEALTSEEIEEMSRLLDESSEDRGK